MSGAEMVSAEAPASDAQTVARALGAVAPMSSNAVTSARYKLLGVAAGPAGVALIAVDDQPGRPYRLHATLPDDAQLVALGRDTATLRLSQGQLLNLKVPTPGSEGMPVTASPPILPAPTMAIGDAQAPGQVQASTDAMFEAQSVSGRAERGGRIERSKDALSTNTGLTLERQD